MPSLDDVVFLLAWRTGPAWKPDITTPKELRDSLTVEALGMHCVPYALQKRLVQFRRMSQSARLAACKRFWDYRFGKCNE